MSTHEQQQARFQCRHILADGRRCRAACLRNEDFCYYHHASRKPVADPARRRSRRNAFTLPLIEDRASIQAAVNEVIVRVAANDIDPIRAARLLAAIQIASRNMPRPPVLKPIETSPGYYDNEIPGPVEEVVHHPTYGEVAPRSEVIATVKRKSLAQQLREEMEELEARNIAEFGE